MFALAAVRTPVDVTLDVLRSCVGRFQGSDGSYFDIGLRHDRLTAAYSTDQGIAFTLYPSSSWSFFATVVDGSAAFQTNDQGIVNQLVWTQSGQSTTFDRISLPARLSIQLSKGQTQISFTGDTAAEYVVEASVELGQWLPISTNTIWTMPMVDEHAGPLGMRFYRLRRR